MNRLQYDILRGNLTLAEEGLASATQEIQTRDQQLKESVDHDAAYQRDLARLRACWAEALANVTIRNQQIERLRTSLEQIQQQRLTWAMACPCSCGACDGFHDFIRDVEDAHEPSERCLAASCGKPPMRGAFCEEHNGTIPSEQQATALDRAYYHGARAAQGIAHQSIVAMDDWIAKGCGNRVLPVKSSACLYIGAPQGKPEPCVLPVGHSGPHEHAEKSGAGHV